MVPVSTVKAIVTILLVIDIFWLLYIIIRGYTESLLRTIIFGLILGLCLGYLQNTKLEKLSFQAIKNDLFPTKVRTYAYTKDEQNDLYSYKVVYTFLEPPPELKVEMDPNGKTFTISDLESVNQVLDQLNLPRVSGGGKELLSITGNQTDLGLYRWDNYEKGTLTLERGLYQNKQNMKSYYCITRITIDSRKY
ncbi:MAG: hypothetical protein ACPLZD_08315 [Candidatus Saccharicenans sp.]|nr:MAG: hypothetical protein C0168_04940 [Candidatus Aminicenantes bacterium]HEK86784.1 hypothetical protein [Candidatus Aminicenantes bacterium]